MIKRYNALAILAATVLLTGSHTVTADDFADAIYFGGPIVTMIRDDDRVCLLYTSDAADE